MMDFYNKCKDDNAIHVHQLFFLNFFFYSPLLIIEQRAFLHDSHFIVARILAMNHWLWLHEL